MSTIEIASCKLQFANIVWLNCVFLCYLKKKFPQAQIVGHKDLDHGKACPCFNAKAEYQNL